MNDWFEKEDERAEVRILKAPKGKKPAANDTGRVNSMFEFSNPFFRKNAPGSPPGPTFLDRLSTRMSFMTNAKQNHNNMTDADRFVSTEQSRFEVKSDEL
jgi:hypothetical protein